MTTRRQTLAGFAAMMALPRIPAFAAPAAGAGEPFSWDLLQQRALELSRRSWAPPPRPSPLVDKITYDAVGQVDYRPEKTLWNDRGAGVRFFPLTSHAQRPVSIAVVDGGVFGTAGHIYYLHLWTLGVQSFGQLAPAHTRHDHVGEQ